MLQKVVAIASVGRLVNFTGRGNLLFRRLTLLFGENGRGKTTLAAVLRSLKSGHGHYITERQTINSADKAKVSVLLASGIVTFSDGTWSHTYGDLEVFDNTFVHDNVYAGDSVEHEHRKNLYRVIVGEEGVTLARKVDDLDARIREASKSIAELKTGFTGRLPNGVTLEKFLTLAPEERLEEKLAAKESELAAMQQSFEIENRGLLRSLKVPSIPDGLSELLSKTLNDISAEALAQVQEHLRACMDEHGQAWVARGLSYAKNDQCPFCAQPIAGNPLLLAYQGYFSESYGALKAAIAGFQRSVEAEFGERALLHTQKTLDDNSALAEFWMQFTESTPFELSFEYVQQALESLRSSLRSLLSAKATSPLDPLDPGQDYERAAARYAECEHAVYEYNRWVETTNGVITATKEATAATDLAVASEKFQQLKTVQARYAPAMAELCLSYQDAMESKKRLEKVKKQAKAELDEYSTAVLVMYEEKMNELLKMFNAGFSITNTKTRYAGGTPSTSYEILINATTIDVGDSKTPAGTACFRSTLSSGDRSCLALAFFLARLEHDPRIAEKVVVLDDPITSQDNFRSTQTQQLLLRLYNKAKQLVVLSHDPVFLMRLWQETAPSEVSTLQLCRSGENTTIQEWDVEGDTRGEYIHNYLQLTRYARNGLGSNLRHIAQSIRLLLEEYLRMKCPEEFARTEWLGSFIKKIREAPPKSPLTGAQRLLGELEDINAYSRKYHHRENPGAASEPISDTELQGYVSRTLALVTSF